MLKGVYDFVTAGRPNVFAGYAIDTTPGIWSGTGQGGPLLYNPVPAAGKGVTAYLLAVSFGLSVASTVAGALGITGGPTTAPSGTSAIGAVGNLRFTTGAPAPQCSVYGGGTVSAAPTTFMPLGHIHTGAITVDTDDDNLIHLGGMIEVGVGNFAALAGSAALTSAVLSIGLIWAEVPND